MGKGRMLAALIVLALAPWSSEASAQSSSLINPSSRPLGSSDYSRIPTYQAPTYHGVYDGKGRRIGTIEETPGPLGTEYTYRDRQGTPRARVPASPGR